MHKLYTQSCTTNYGPKGLIIILFLAFFGQLPAQNTSKPITNAKAAELVHQGSGSVAFIENRGQWPGHVLYRADIPGGQVLATPEGMLIGKYDPASVAARSTYDAKLEEVQTHRRSKSELGPAPGVKGHGWRFNFIGGRQASAENMVRKGESQDYYNYLTASSSIRGVRSYSEIAYKDVYPGIDVKYYTGGAGILENDIIVSPGADESVIALKIEGIDNLRMDENGGLIMPTTVGDINIPHPVSYLVDENGVRSDIQVNYKLTGANTLAFDIPAHDKSKTLVIDPIVMRWATWVSGSTSENGHCHGIDLDGLGNIYVTGRTGAGLITVGAFQSTLGGFDAENINMFIGKYTEPSTPGGAGTRVWQTYLGGSSTTNPYALNIGPDGNIYIAGLTDDNLLTSYGTGAPAQNWTNRTIVGFLGEDQQCFVAKMDTSGAWAIVREIGSVENNLSPSLYDIRTLNTPEGFDLIAVGNVLQQDEAIADGDVPAPTYPNGTVVSTGFEFLDAYALRISNDLNTIVWTKQYTSDGTENEFTISTVSNNGNTYVAGCTNGATNISYNNPSQQTSEVGATDGWLANLNPSNGNINWSRYFNSDQPGDSTTILCMELTFEQSALVIGGLTQGLATSNVTNDTAYKGNTDFFVAKVPVSGISTIWGTYYGGSGVEYNMMGLNVDQNDDVYVLGYSYSKDVDTADFPIQNGAYNSNPNERQVVFCKLTGSTGDTLLYSTYMGGSEDDYDPAGERGIKFSNCQIYLAISSESSDFPLTEGTLTPTISQSDVGTLEPLIVSMANPPNIAGNGIISGKNQTLNCGQTAVEVVDSAPSYIIANIIRDGTTETNNTINAYPSGLPGVHTFQWQESFDTGVTWYSITSANSGNLTFDSAFTTPGLFEFRRIIDADACSQGDSSSVAIIIVNSVPVPSVSVTPSAICPGDSSHICLTPTNYAHYLWNNGATTSCIYASEAGTYYAKVTTTLNCSTLSDSVAVVKTQVGTFNASLPVSTLCYGDSTILTVTDTNFTFTPAGSITWIDTTTGILKPSTSTNYLLIAPVTCALDTFRFAVNVGHPVAQLTSTNNTICAGDSVFICSSPTTYTSYQWNTGATSACIYATAEGSYYVRVTDSLNCSAQSDSISVIVKQIGTFNATVPQTTLCYGDSTILTVTDTNFIFTPTGSISWIDTTTGILKPDTSTNYLLIAPVTCAVDTFQFTIDVGHPVVHLTASNNAICSDTPVVLCADTGFNSYLWSTSSADPCITTAIAGYYSVVVTDQYNCTAQSSIVRLQSLPPGVFSYTLSDSMLCPGTQATFDFVGALQLTFSPFNSITFPDSLVVQLAPDSSTDYTVIAEIACLPNDTFSLPIQLLTVAPVNIISDSTVICPNDSIMLCTGASYGQYTWSNGSSASCIFASQAGSYYVTVTEPNTCTAVSSPLTLTNTTVPPFDYTLGSPTVCYGGSTTLTYSGAIDVQIQPGSLATHNGSSQYVLQPDTTTDFTVIALQTCNVYDTVDFTLPVYHEQVNISTVSSGLICPNDTAQICAPDSFATYNWSTGQNTSCIYVTGGGNYYVSVTDASKCIAISNNVDITLKPVSSITISVALDTFAVYDDTVVQWYLNGSAISGATGQSYVAQQPGYYTVMISDTDGCTTTSNAFYYTNGASGIGTIEPDMVDVYPNPLSSGSWNLVVSTGFIGQTVEIYDDNGRIVFSSEIHSLHSEISPSFASGVYLLKINSPGNMIVKKIVKL